MSDMLEDSDGLNFERADLSKKRTSEVIAQLRARNAIPALKSVTLMRGLRKNEDLANAKTCENNHFICKDCLLLNGGRIQRTDEKMFA